MNTNRKLLAASLLITAVLSATGYSQQPKTAGERLDVLEMKTVPDGNYLLNLQTEGKERWVNIKVQTNSARCVNSSDPGLKDIQGKFELYGNGVFTISFRKANYTATQSWLFRPDGSAIVKESPDRGEKQRAVPVNDDSVPSGNKSR